MHAINTFSIDFVLRKCETATSFGLIYARVTVNSVVREISIKERIADNLWNSGSESVTGKTPAIRLINLAIENIRFRLKEKYRALEDKVQPISADIIKNASLGT